MLSNSVSITLKLGKVIAKGLKKGDIICLFGNLGAGKTVLAKGIAMGLGIDKDKIISPTFVLIREQTGKNNICFYHFDFYRLNSPSDISILGYEEYFYGEGITVIEWPDRLKYLLPKEFLKIDLKVKERNKRSILISGKGLRYKSLAEKINENFRN